MSDLETLKDNLLAEVTAAGDEAAIEAVRVNALGKKGSISELLKTLGTMTPEERQTRGAAINALKTDVFAAIAARKFIPGGRYLYASGKPKPSVQNCMLLSVDDTRESLAETEAWARAEADRLIAAS